MSRLWAEYSERVLLGTGSTVASLLFIWALARQFMPPWLRDLLASWVDRFTASFQPYVTVTFPEYTDDGFRRSDAYTVVKSYLSSNAAYIGRARRLLGDLRCGKDGDVALSMDDTEDVLDVFRGVKLWWATVKTSPTAPTVSLYPSTAFQERRSYRLTFHRRERQLVEDEYLRHVVSEGRNARQRERQRKLYTNNPSYDDDCGGLPWSHVPFEHPATFETLAMDSERKREIMDDLRMFRKSKDYYARIGKPWKRGYLLHGPPGTGKSTLVAAVANFLEYDVYDLELTAVKNNSVLRRLLIETESRALVVIEDIDCSLDLTGQRPTADGDKLGDGEEGDRGAAAAVGSKVTLSGLLNFIDGLWSACGGERLLVFTTNRVEKLDPALIRRGRMDKHIELSYCTFEGFKVLARNYLGVHSHPLFPTVQQLVEETKITPADVAELLMPRTFFGGEEEVATCLENLVAALRGRPNPEHATAAAALVAAGARTM
ncbi:hypothetical protein Taro_054761 [Colocasia esculenta]|uniref:AAA+ ATPase domain-containing protein n=1 Tax=Colocasia esculenta TaxID=4460 RepID=A0A843XS74_COLES|nr:hypothetical protein [Colocasia esculenta]